MLLKSVDQLDRWNILQLVRYTFFTRHNMNLFLFIWSSARIKYQQENSSNMNWKIFVEKDESILNMRRHFFTGVVKINVEICLENKTMKRKKFLLKKRKKCINTEFSFMESTKFLFIY